MQVTSIKHIGVYVEDIEKMVSFYKDALGFIEIANYEDHGKHVEQIIGKKNQKLRICKLISLFGQKKGMGDMLEFVYYPNGEMKKEQGKLYANGIMHIAMGVKDVQVCYENVLKNGGGAVCAPVKVRESGKYMAFCTDPEGNYLELIENA